MRRWWLYLAVVYLALLALSHWVRASGRDAPRLQPAGLRTAALAEVARTPEGRELAPTGRQIDIAWREWNGPAADPSALTASPLILLHGSPGSHREVAGLGETLAAERRVVAPDLPGFGASETRIEDYSSRAHAGYVLALADHLGLDRFHLGGFSLGGAVALEIYDLAPERVTSLTLLAATGVQELELLGDHGLNHALHSLQLAGLRGLKELTPHFGRFDGGMLDVPYARNFYDTDQRPLRGILERFEPPALILHGETDPLVPVAAAWEHHRLMPQSEIEVYPSDHFFVFRDNGDLAAPRLLDFLARVDEGKAVARDAATEPRRLAASQPFDAADLPPLEGMALVVILVLLAVATLVSEDLTCIAAGLLVAQGRLPFLDAAIACSFGIWAGDMMLYLAGRVLGPPALQRRPLRWWIDREATERAAAWYRRRGLAVIFLSRFLPGARLPTYFAAGALKSGFWRFAAYFSLAVAVWTPILVGLAAALGEGALVLLGRSRLGMLALLGTAIVFLVALRLLVVPAFTHEGRRRLAGRWQRWRHWEFWPPWLVYPPVVVWVLILAVRHRGLTVFTAANPGMPAGGFIDEPKDDILRRLEAAGAPLPAWSRLPDHPAARSPALEDFRRRHRLDWPVVLKPNAGQRGAGVAVVRDHATAERYLEAARVPTLVQAHVAGVEAGVFYVRRPGEERGRVISITEKRMPEVVGDGQRTVGELILDDPRAVALADLYLAAQGGERDQVPADGERVSLVEIGTHCRGAVFTDGAARKTESLESAVDRISRGVDGFYFGRYDLRAASWDEMAAGRFTVIELNGVTSEMTHVYDRRHSILYAWRTFFRQWRLAFEIGAANQALGAPTTSLRSLASAALGYRRRARGQGPAGGAPPADERHPTKQQAPTPPSLN